MKKLAAVILILSVILAASSCTGLTGGTKPSSVEAQEPSAGVPAIETAAAETDTIGESDDAAAAVRLKGTVGDQTVHLSFTEKDGRITGTYYCDRDGKEIPLEGSSEDGRMLFLDEFNARGDIIGAFELWYVPGIRLTGTWTDAGSKVTREVKLAVIDGIPSDAVWAGEWFRLDTGRFNSATLVVYDETDDAFSFHLDAYHDAHMGFVSGTAALRSSKAEYRDAATGALLTFSLKDGIIEIRANDAANQLGGAGIVFEGRFTQDALPEDTLLSMGYVFTEAQEEAFRTVTGADYELFLNTAGNRSEGTDIDGYEALVYEWWVSGFGGIYESIAMFLPDGTFCAGVVDPDNSAIKVYTNSRFFTDVPKTIRQWAKDFPDMTAEFIGTADS
jgi:hypothetical protein